MSDFDAKSGGFQSHEDHQRWLLQQKDDEIERLRGELAEHARLHDELNTVLHPNGDGPPAPSLCDLVAFASTDFRRLRNQTADLRHEITALHVTEANLRAELGTAQPKAERLDRLLADADCCAAWAKADALRALLERIEPHLDAIVCYASTMGEHEPNRIAHDVRAALAKEPKA